MPQVHIPALYPVIFPLSRVIVRTIFTLLGGWKVEGRERVPRTGGLLVAANHLSYADPPAVGLAMPRRCWFMGKDAIFAIPVVAQLSRLHLAFPLRVDAAVDREAMRRVETLLRAGEAVCIYPEGHVSLTGELLPLQPGAALMAIRAGAPILPTALIGTGRAIRPPRCLPGFVPGGVRVRFGGPIHPDEIPAHLPRRERAEWLTRRVEQSLRTLLSSERSSGS